VGIKSGDKIARAPLVIADPSYISKQSGHVKTVGKIVRSICILDHPIPHTDDKTSCQIIIPQKQIEG
jgi:Rab GDP dissociation inhibitor